MVDIPEPKPVYLLYWDSPWEAWCFHADKTVRKEVSVQVASFDGCPDTSEEKAGTCTKCAQVDDQLWQGAVWQEAVSWLCSIRGPEAEIGKCFQNHIPAMDTTEPEAPSTLGDPQKQDSNSISILQLEQQKCRSAALKAFDVHEQGQQRKPHQRALWLL